MFKPTLEQVKKYRQGYDRVPICMEVNADLETPIMLLKKIKSLGCRSRQCFLLESVDGGGNWGRYSFLGFDPLMTIQVSGGETTIVREGNERIHRGNPMDRIRSALAEFKSPRIEDMPRFVGGAVGYFSYDMIRYVETLPDKNESDREFPDCYLMVADKVIAYDRFTQKMMIVVNAQTAGNLEENYKKAADQILELYERIKSAGFSDEPKQAAPKPVWRSNLTKEQFETNVEKAKQYIRDGDIFQVVLSQRFSAELSVSAEDVYRVLRVTNPSPYMYYLKMDEIEIAGASPETLLRKVGNRLETCPIAGTRPRGKDAEQDEKLKDELLKDEKELAEHTMLVDLGRNDLGRVSKFGSVQVVNYGRVEYYSQVMHLTSLLNSEIREDCDAFDALNSILPAGTLSGAPKVRAMQIIDEFENTRRGPYGGAIGYIGFDGDMDVCITIRTIVKKGTVAHVQAGAGIVADSVPETEYYESYNKAKAVLLAVEKAGENQ